MKNYYNQRSIEDNKQNIDSAKACAPISMTSKSYNKINVEADNNIDNSSIRRRGMLYVNFP